MAEHPILFSGPMVRAILAERKMQTRRIVRTGAYPHDGVHWWEPAVEPGNEGRWSAKDGLGGIFHIPCPFGVPGDLLWVRETWYCDDARVPERGPLPKIEPEDLDRRLLYYRASHLAPDGSTYTGFSGETMRHPWRPSIHMPRWASRLTLRVADVRIERLQEITEEDAAAEGMPSNPYYLADGSRDEAMSISARANFSAAWDEINGDRAPWKSNPWVWVVSFERIETDR